MSVFTRIMVEKVVTMISRLPLKERLAALNYIADSFGPDGHTAQRKVGQ
jgi:hypothetical protein